MKKIYCLILLLPLFSGAQTFFTTYGGSQYDLGCFILEDSQGNFIVCGDSGFAPMVSPDADMLLLKADAFGNILWAKTYGDTATEIARCVRQTLDGGFILHGDQNGSPYTDAESMLLKTNSNGDSLWATFGLGGMGSRWGVSVISLADSSFIIGSVNDDIQSYNPYQILRVDKTGHSMWSQYTDVVQSTYFTGWGSSLIESYDHCYVTVGIEELNFQSQDVISISKVDSAGNILWSKMYSASLNCEGISLSVCSDSGYVISGYTNSFGAGDNDMLVMKVDKNGDSLWTRTFGGTGDDILTAIQQTSDGGFIAFGYSNSFGNGYDAIILKLNSQGDSTWQKSFGGTEDEIVMHGIICRDGGFALTGSTKSSGAGNEDVFILKTDSTGNIINNIFEKEAGRIAIHPNPFRYHLQIKTNAFAGISVYNILGEVKAEFPENTNDVLLNTDDWMKGIYFIRIKYPNGTVRSIRAMKVCD